MEEFNENNNPFEAVEETNVTSDIFQDSTIVTDTTNVATPLSVTNFKPME